MSTSGSPKGRTASICFFSAHSMAKAIAAPVEMVSRPNRLAQSLASTKTSISSFNTMEPNAAQASYSGPWDTVP